MLIMCQNCPIESALHLFFLCPYAMNVWWLICSKLGFQLFKPHDTVEQIRYESLAAYKNSSNGWVATWIMWFVCVTWFLWKERNERVFRGERRQPNYILAEMGVLLQFVFSFSFFSLFFSC